MTGRLFIDKNSVLCLAIVAFISIGTTSVAQSHEDMVASNDHITKKTGHHNNEDHDGEHIEEYNPAETILHHIKDAHEWHILTTKSGHHVTVPLPVILYSRHSGFHLFMSNKLAHGHNYKGFETGHGTIEVTSSTGEHVEKNVDGKILELDENGELVEAGLPLDFSITKNVFMMFITLLIMLIVFLGVAGTYKKKGISAPKGLQGFLEPLIVFVEEDIAMPNIGREKYERYVPYLLTLFFFILLNNLLGLVPFFPFGANVSGNIAFTMVLAVFTLLVINLSGNREYWKHIFLTPGVPFWLLPIMVPVELIGIIIKPFALMIRLFANITAGHIIILSLVSLIFIFKSVFMSLPTMLMVLFMFMVELLVAFLQAYIFTLLSSLFIGLAVPEHHHE